jgi:CO/xanthine dehydrogenase Mo-binding subunit
MPAVGNNVARKDGIGKATGRALYADDLVFPGMLMVEPFDRRFRAGG